MMKPQENNIQVFNADIIQKGGYDYTSGERCSSRLANVRISNAVQELAKGCGQRIIDIGCGDGTYTAEMKTLNPSEVLGIDAAEAAVELARQRMANDSRFHFETRSVYDLSPFYGAFDLAIVRGVLHHLREPAKAVAELVKTAPMQVVVEPNGFNPIVKVLELISPYHRLHEERSFFPFILRRWFATAGASIDKAVFVNTVPMFCPDGFARFCDRFSPLIERLPLVYHFGCGQYVFRARRIAT
jgi:2-polyprenyl-3-methyl-5-hydroxy-6-metoxy-1,4-benzoquinol methylase